MKDIIRKKDIGYGISLVDMWHKEAELPSQVFDQHVIALFKSPLTSLYTTNKKEVRAVISEGDVGVYSSGVYELIRNYNPVRKLHLYLKPDSIAAILNKSGAPADIELVTNFHTKDPLIRELLLSIDRESRHEPADNVYIDTLVCALVLHLSKNYARANTVLPSAGRLRENEIYQIRNFILANLEKKFSLADLAAVVNLSPFHFARLFKQTTGVSAYTFVRSTRVDYAKDLMKSALTISEVAVKTGFHDESHFSKVFKQVTGASPSVFKKAGTYRKTARIYQ